MPVPFTAAQMKAWLETNDFPTQQQFADIIDTMVHQNQQALDTAAAALAGVAGVLKVHGYFKVGTVATSGSTTPVPAAPVEEYRMHGCTIGVIQTVPTPFLGDTATVTVTVTFDTPQADGNYAVEVHTATSALGALTPLTLVSKAASNFVIQFNLPPPWTVAVNRYVQFKVFP